MAVEFGGRLVSAHLTVQACLYITINLYIIHFYIIMYISPPDHKSGLIEMIESKYPICIALYI